MLKISSARSRFLRPTSGFTLVEMLVSVALVLIMMTMFAQVFVMSTDSLSKQRGIAENDQRSRMLSSTIRNDLNGRTFRDIFPFRRGEDTRQLGHSLTRRAGYFEIDEGNPTDDTDDVLQFTASTNIRLQYSDNSPFVGVAAIPMSGVGGSTIRSSINVTVGGGSNNQFFFNDSGALINKIAVGSRIWVVATPNVPYTVSSVGSSPGPAPNNTIVTVTSTITQSGSVGLFLSENEPDFDDGIFNNANGISPFAEVCYFMRNGNLYRRVLLIRDTSTGGDVQPTWSTGVPIMWNGASENYPFTADTTVGTTFWRDFDYSAFYFNGKTPGPLAPGVRFHDSRESLSNVSQAPQMIYDESPLTATPPGSALSFPVSLGLPYLRFGHGTLGFPQDMSNTDPGADGLYGTADDGSVVIATRFILQECASSQFLYPGKVPGAGNPFNRTDLTLNSSGIVSQYSDNFRRGEDILMANVLSFDVKVWDPVRQGFVDLGDSVNPSGTFGSNAAGRMNRVYGPTNHFRFDTWHPAASSIGNGEPPYFPATVGFDAFAGVKNVDDDGDGNTDTMTDPVYGGTIPDWKELGWPGSDDRVFALSAIQITINFRDVSSNQIRQMTMVQSLVDQVKPPTLTSEPPEE